MQLRHWLWKAMRSRTSSCSRGESDPSSRIPTAANAANAWARSGLWE